MSSRTENRSCFDFSSPRYVRAFLYHREDDEKAHLLFRDGVRYTKRSRAYNKPCKCPSHLVPILGSRTGMASLGYSFYVGSYSKKMGHVDGKGKGVALVRLLPSGDMTLEGSAPPTDVGVNPTYLCFDGTTKVLYVVNECDRGRVAAYSQTDSETGALTLLCELPSRGKDPCYVEVFDSSAGKLLLVANYSSGSTAFYRLDDQGKISNFSFHEHTMTSKGPNVARQEAPHAHMAKGFGANKDRVLVPDLGTDKILSFQLPAMSLVDSGGFQMKPGDGPRHLEFHPSLKFVYILSELACTVTVVQCDLETGDLREPVQVVSTLLDGFDNSDGSNTCAHVQLHPSGKFLYVSNRGGKDHSCTLFHVAEDGSSLTFMENNRVIAEGELCPRAFNITPDGLWMVVAYQDTSRLVSFRIDQDTGACNIASKLEVPTPVCIAWC